jgi:predicted RNA-binding Zn ribbon-like protein
MTEENRTTPGGLLLVGGRLCLDFCNTIERLSQPPHDSLSVNGFRALVRWGREVGALDEIQTEKLYQLEADAVFEEALALRDALYTVYTARLNHSEIPPAALARVNDWVTRSFAARELRPTADGFEWVWRERTAPEVLLWEIALSVGEMLTHDDLNRVRQCPGCGWLFYDQSRNNRRTWCDMRFCGNRAKNKRFHAKQKADVKR